MSYDEDANILDDEDTDDDELDTKIILTNEEGKDIEFEFLELIDYKDEEYVVLLPNDGEGEVVILRIESINDEEEEYVSVDDEETLDAVYNMFKDRYEDEYDFADDDSDDD